jgi:TyrR family helix-turn-helix protein
MEVKMDHNDITKELLEKLYYKFGNGRKIAKELNVSPSSIQRRLKKYNIYTYKPKYKELYSKEHLESLYKKYGTLSEISKILKCSKKTVTRLFKEYQIPYHKTGRLDFFNQNFFNDYNCNDREIRSKVLYWLGFIAADGCIRTKKNLLQIKLKIQDIEQLRQLQKDINSTSKLYKHIGNQSSHNPKHNNAIGIVIHLVSKKLINSLSKFGITDNKTLTLRFPKNLIEHPEVHSFCLGYFDGDGGVYISKKRQMEMGICGTENFCNTLKKIITDKCNMLEKNKNKLAYNTNIYTVRFNGNISCKKIFEWLYQDVIKYGDFCMTRKFNIVNSHFKLL